MLNLLPSSSTVMQQPEIYLEWMVDSLIILSNILYQQKVVKLDSSPFDLQQFDGRRLIVQLLHFNKKILNLSRMAQAERNQQQQIVDLVAQAPATYFSLMEKVGTKGKYQNILTLIFGLTWYVTGIILMSTAFLFLNPKFDCEEYGLLTDSCYDFVCSLPQTEWEKFIASTDNQFKSLANSFDERFFCQNQFYLNLYSTFAYFGALVGYIIISFFSDNWGRRKTTFLGWSIAVFGILLVQFAVNIQMAGVGLFFAGLGGDSVLNITLTIMVQVYQKNLCSRVQAAIQGAFTFGALVVTLFYYLFEDWSISTLYALLIPAVITLVLIVMFLQESPMFLVLQGPERALKAFNKIGKLNKGHDNCLTIEQIEEVIQGQQAVEYNRLITPIDLCRFASLRLITICGATFSIATYMMYYGPILIVDQIGFDMYTSNVIFNISDLLTYYPLYLMIGTLRRKKACLILFSIATVLSGVLIFITVPSDCGDICAEIIIQIILVFIFRFCISMEFALIGIYTNELLPTRARSIGGGMMSVFGTVGSTICPIIMGLLTRNSINPFILFTILGIFGTSSYTFLKETYQQPIPDEIEEIEYEKLKKRSIKQSSHSKAKLK